MIGIQDKATRVTCLKTGLAIALLLLITWTLAFKRLTTRPDEGTTVIIGLTSIPDILDVPYYIALEERLFEKRGINVAYKSLNGDASTIRALLSGSIQFGSAGVFSWVKAVDRGADVAMVSSVNESHDYVLLGNKTFGSDANLLGIRIGIGERGSITETLALYYLSSQELSRDDVKLISVGTATERLRALAEGRVDATLLHMEDALRGSDDMGFVVVEELAKVIPVPMSALGSTGKQIEQQPQVAQMVIEALNEACAIAYNDPIRFKDVALKYLDGTDEESVQLVYKDLKERGILARDASMTIASIENALKAFEANGYKASHKAQDYIRLRNGGG